MKRYLLPLMGALLVISLTACGSEETDVTTTAASTTHTVAVTTTTTVETTTVSKTAIPTTLPTTTKTLPEKITVTKPTTTLPTTAKTTTARQGACDLATSYLEQSFLSYNGLVKQLIAAGCAESDAVYAADNCGADWNEQAVKRMQYHLDGMGISRKQLIQWMNNDGFTEAQINYALEYHNV